jgi:hypothetical protein
VDCAIAPVALEPSPFLVLLSFALQRTLLSTVSHCAHCLKVVLAASDNAVFFFFYFYLFTCAYIALVISPPDPHPHSLPSPPHFQAEPVLPLSLILLKRRHKHNEKDKAFLLVELRMTIQRDS